MKDQITKLRDNLSKAREGGSSTVSVDQMIAELDSLLAHQSLHPLNVATATEIFKAAVSAGEQAIKSAMLLASGGAAALLALLGHLVTSPNRQVSADLMRGISAGLICFGAAFVLVAVAYGFRYLAQSAFSRSTMASITGMNAGASMWDSRGRLHRTVCLCLLLFTVPLFCIGGWRVYQGLEKQGAYQKAPLGEPCGAGCVGCTPRS